MSKRILAIEDDRTAGWLSRAAVLPYEIELAHGAVDAVRRLRQRSFDVLVTSSRTHIDEDLALHEESRCARPAIKSIFLAPTATPPDVIAALRARVFACLIEPFEPGDVVDVIRAAAEAADWRDGIQVSLGSCGMDFASRHVQPGDGRSTHRFHECAARRRQQRDSRRSAHRVSRNAVERDGTRCRI